MDNSFETLPQRLRGIYTLKVDMSIGPLDGKDTFTRDFGDQGDLQARAALAIERLEKGESIDVVEINNLVDELMEPADPMNMGKTYVVPIRKEAADRITDLYVPF